MENLNNQFENGEEFNINSLIKYEQSPEEELNELRSYKKHAISEIEKLKKQIEGDKLNLVNFNFIVQSKQEKIELLEENVKLLREQNEELKSKFKIRTNPNVTHKKRKIAKKRRRLGDSRKSFSAFNMFLREEWSKLKDKGSISYATLIKEKSPKWNSMSDSEKKKYEEIAEKENKKFNLFNAK